MCLFIPVETFQHNSELWPLVGYTVFILCNFLVCNVLTKKLHFKWFSYEARGYQVSYDLRAYFLNFIYFTYLNTGTEEKYKLLIRENKPLGTPRARLQ